MSQSHKVSRRSFLKGSLAAAGASALGGTFGNWGVNRVSAQGFDWKKYAGTQINFQTVNHPMLNTLIAELPKFEALTGIKVIPDQPTDADWYKKKVLAVTTAPEKVDVIHFAGESDRWKFIGEGFLEDLNPFVNNPALTNKEVLAFDDIAPGQLPICSSRDGKKLFAIPFVAGGQSYCYRRDIYEKLGLKVPTTLEEFENNLKATHDPANEVYGMVTRGIGWLAVHPFSTIMKAYGAWYVDKDSKAAVNTPDFIKAYTYYGNMLRLYGPPGALQLDDPKGVALFSQGKAAHNIMPNPYQVGFMDPEKSKVAGNVGWFNAPKGPGGQGDSWGPLGLSICSFSTKKEAAWYFIQWFASAENQLKNLLAGQPAIRASAYKAPEFVAKRTGDFGRYMDVIEVSIRNATGRSFPPAPDLIAAREAVGIAITAAIQGENVQAAADKANVTYQKLLDDAGGIPADL